MGCPTGILVGACPTADERTARLLLFFELVFAMEISSQEIGRIEPRERPKEE
jgi:hypothetical protein